MPQGHVLVPRWRVRQGEGVEKAARESIRIFYFYFYFKLTLIYTTPEVHHALAFAPDKIPGLESILRQKNKKQKTAAFNGC